MKHKTTGLARRCSPGDLILVTGGLQCGNCLAYEETYHAQPVHIRLSQRKFPDGEVFLQFVRSGGEVFVTRQDTEHSKVVRRSFWGQGQLYYPLQGPTDPDIRLLAPQEWDAFRQVYDVREAYSINHTWQAIRSF